MAISEHLKIAEQGTIAWNNWRNEFERFPDLSHANLSNVNLSGANLTGVDFTQAELAQTDLSGADLSNAKLPRAFLVEANLTNANLQNAHLSGADLAAAILSGSDLTGANLDAAELIGSDLRFCNFTEADLTLARFRYSNLQGANFESAILDGTLFANIDLTEISNLELCQHFGPSIFDFDTLKRSLQVPASFLIKAGLPLAFVDKLPGIFSRADQYFSCFISFSYKDKKFADRLYGDLLANGISCWYAPHDMKIGPKLLDQLSTAILGHQKVLLILSKNSIASEWVEDEVSLVFEVERKEKRTVLFPIRIDEAVMESNEPWAGKVRQRHIGDFRKWKNKHHYENNFLILKRDLAKN